MVRPNPLSRHSFTETAQSNSPPPASHVSSSSATATATAESSADATSKLAEAIDDFLGDLEKRFKGISDEILTRLDDMAERCDRLEQEMLLKDTTVAETSKKEEGR